MGAGGLRGADGSVEDARSRSLPPSIRRRQCTGGTRLGRGGHELLEQGRTPALSDDPTAAADGGTTASATPDGSDPRAATRRAFPILDDAARSPDASVCPFFRRDDEGALAAPLGYPDESNRCAAIGTPRPQSLRQQELVCLRTTHADCPRYLRGALAVTEGPGARRAPTIPRATLAALLVLVLSAGISLGFVVQRGGIDLPAAAPTASPTQVAVVATEAPRTTPLSPSAAASPSPTPAATASPSPSPTASPSPSPAPSPAPTAAATSTPRPTATPRSDRYALLEPCPDRDGCWIYTVRAGDNLYSIANYFGIRLKTIYDWNPKYADGARLRAGAEIRMPPPTR